MEYKSLDDILKNRYDNCVSYIKSKNSELEREYFTKNRNRIPMGEMMQDTSYEDHFMNFKEMVKDGNEEEINQVFMLLEDYFLFSKGHDMMFKKKLEADIYTSAPIDNLIYPKLLEAVKKKYNEVSILPENPRQNENLNGIDTLIATYMDVQSLLYLLYCHDFQFPNGWEAISDNQEEILTILKESGMTIGDFLHSFIDFKCQIMKEIGENIENPNLKITYLEKVENLREEKQKETKNFAYVDLPITYFSNHTILDFLSREKKSSILKDTTPKPVQKIILPKS